MKKVIILSIILLNSAIAIATNDGVITVLEAPLFEKPDIKSKILQYARRGKILYVHGQEFALDPLKYAMDESLTDERVSQYQETYTKNYRDPLFPKNSVYIPNEDSKFFKTLVASGAEAYVLKEHIKLLYKDLREANKPLPMHDPTDYRIEEPLPKNYPFISPTGYRGQFSFGMGTPSTQSYPYSENIDDIGYDYLKEVSAVWSRQVDFDLSRRFYFGGIILMQTSSKKYTTSNLNTTEDMLRLGAGPMFSYDVWRNESAIFNLYSALIFNFYDQITVTQTVKSSSLSEENTFSSIHFTPRIGGNFQIREVLSSFDLVLGFNNTLDLPHTYSGNINTDNPQYWSDSYENKWMANLTYSIGLQSSY